MACGAFCSTENLVGDACPSPEHMPRIHANFTTHMKYHMNCWNVSLWCQFNFFCVLYFCEVDSLVYSGLIFMWIPFIVTPTTEGVAKSIYSPVCVRVKEESPKYLDLLEETSLQENFCYTLIVWVAFLPSFCCVFMVRCKHTCWDCEWLDHLSTQFFLAVALKSFVGNRWGWPAVRDCASLCVVQTVLWIT